MIYPKIPTLFKRDPATNHRTVIEGQYSRPEFACLEYALWRVTEMIDGMNIRVEWNGRDCVRFLTRNDVSPMPEPNDGGETILCAMGIGDTSQIPQFLLKALHLLFPLSRFAEHFADTPVTLYGEGYGAKIGHNGAQYIADGQSFALFDVRIGGWWLERLDVKGIAGTLGVECVPSYGFYELLGAVELVKSDDFASRGFPNCPRPEGIVLRPTAQLFDRKGHRIIAKLKCGDFADG